MPNDKPKPEPKPPTPDSFGLVATAVFDMHKELGKQSQLCETLDRHYMEQREDIRALEKVIEAQGLEFKASVQSFKASIKSLNRTMYLGWLLLVTIGAAVIWMVVRVWEILLPFLQLKLGLPTK